MANRYDRGRYITRHDEEEDRYDRTPERGRGYEDDRERYGSSRREDRGFWERASDEVSSWLGDEDAERRREMDEREDRPNREGSPRYYDREGQSGYPSTQRMGTSRGSSYGRQGYSASNRATQPGSQYGTFDKMNASSYRSYSPEYSREGQMFGTANRAYERRFRPDILEAGYESDHDAGYGRQSSENTGYGARVGSGYGNYAQDYSTRGRHTGRGPRGYQRSDERITEDVNEQLMRHGEIDATEIEVKVNNGEVTLSGTVEDRWTKRMTEDLVEDISGVKNVVNLLRVNSNLGQAQQQQNQSWQATQNRQNLEGEESNQRSKATTTKNT